VRKNGVCFAWVDQTNKLTRKDKNKSLASREEGKLEKVGKIFADEKISRQTYHTPKVSKRHVARTEQGW